MTKPFREDLVGILYNIFRKCFNVSMNHTQVETLNKEAGILADLIEKKADLAALAGCERLNKAVAKSFKLIGEDMEATNAKNEEILASFTGIQDEIDNIQVYIKAFKDFQKVASKSLNNVNKLETRIKKLEVEAKQVYKGPTTVEDLP